MFYYTIIIASIYFVNEADWRIYSSVIYTIIGYDNGLSPGILLTGPLGTHFSEILIAIHAFSFKKMYLKMSSAKWRPYCPGEMNYVVCSFVHMPVTIIVCILVIWY